MIDYGVVVTSAHRYEIKRVDLDYFASDEDTASRPGVPATPVQPS
jgi:hypothetical protein